MFWLRKTSMEIIHQQTLSSGRLFEAARSAGGDSLFYF
jgi:hypothetical protein